MANVVVAGNIHIVDDPESEGGSAVPYEIGRAIVIQFESTDLVRKALLEGKVSFTVFAENSTTN